MCEKSFVLMSLQVSLEVVISIINFAEKQELLNTGRSYEYTMQVKKFKKHRLMADWVVKGFYDDIFFKISKGFYDYGI